MKKFAVYGIITASVLIGEYEADSPEQAEEKAQDDRNANWHPTLCSQCAGKVELGDIYETQVEEL